MKHTLIIICLALICFTSCDNGKPTFDQQQYHFNENFKLATSLQKQQVCLIDSSDKYRLLGCKLMDTNKINTALLFLDSAKKLNQIGHYIINHTPTPNQ